MGQQEFIENVRRVVADCIADHRILQVSLAVARIRPFHPDLSEKVIEEEVIAAGLGASVPMKLGGRVPA